MELASSYDQRIKGESSKRSSQMLDTSSPSVVLTETEEKYLKNLQVVLEAEGKKRQAEVEKLDEQMKSRIGSLKEEQERAQREAEEYYSGVQRKLLEDQKLLKVRACGGIQEPLRDASRFLQTHQG